MAFLYVYNIYKCLMSSNVKNNNNKINIKDKIV